MSQITLTQPAGGRQTAIREITGITATNFSLDSLAFWHTDGVFTAASDGTAIHCLVVGRDTTNNILYIIDLHPGDICVGDYTGATTNLVVGNGVDLESSTQFDATDETVGSDGHFVVIGLNDPSSGKLRVMFKDD